LEIGRAFGEEINGVVDWKSEVRVFERLQNSMAIVALKEGAAQSAAFL
jgi:hypothetical protein